MQGIHAIRRRESELHGANIFPSPADDNNMIGVVRRDRYSIDALSSEDPRRSKKLEAFVFAAVEANEWSFCGKEKCAAGGQSSYRNPGAFMLLSSIQESPDDGQKLT